MNDQPIFDHEKLDVYQVELSFIAWSSGSLVGDPRGWRGFVSRGFDSYRAREDEKPRDEDENDHEDE